MIFQYKPGCIPLEPFASKNPENDNNNAESLLNEQGCFQNQEVSCTIDINTKGSNKTWHIAWMFTLMRFTDKFISWWIKESSVPLRPLSSGDWYKL